MNGLNVVSMLGLRPTVKTFLGTDVAANTEISETVPAGKWWEILSVTVALVQGITNTPQPVLQIDDGTDVIGESFGCTTAQAVSTTCRYTWSPGLTISGLIGATTGVRAVAPLPSGLQLLAPGSHIKTVTVGIGANSNYGIPAIRVIEYA